MPEVEDDGQRFDSRAKERQRQAITRRGHRLLVTVARIELAMSGLEPVDRLLALNTALENVLHDAEGER